MVLGVGLGARELFPSEAQSVWGLGGSQRYRSHGASSLFMGTGPILNIAGKPLCAGLIGRKCSTGRGREELCEPVCLCLCSLTCVFGRGCNLGLVTGLAEMIGRIIGISYEGGQEATFKGNC